MEPFDALCFREFRCDCCGKEVYRMLDADQVAILCRRCGEVAFRVENKEDE
jgi:hypothetical protein